LALAVIHDGGRRSEAARIGGVGLQSIRDWVLRFNASGPEGLDVQSRVQVVWVMMEAVRLCDPLP
jgi:transposase